MRSSRNFHSEWGNFAPEPSFMSSVRIALVSATIGATAGAAVAASLVQRPEDSIGRMFATRSPLITSSAAAAPLANDPERLTPFASAATNTALLARASASTVSSVASMVKSGGTAPTTTAPTTTLSKLPSTVVATATPIVASAVTLKSVPSPRSTIRKRHRHSVSDTRKHWHQDRKIRPSFQSPYRPLFAQSRFSLTRDQW